MSVPAQQMHFSQGVCEVRCLISSCKSQGSYINSYSPRKVHKPERCDGKLILWCSNGTWKPLVPSSTTSTSSMTGSESGCGGPARCQPRLLSCRKMCGRFDTRCQPAVLAAALGAGMAAWAVREEGGSSTALLAHQAAWTWASWAPAWLWLLRRIAAI